MDFFFVLLIIIVYFYIMEKKYKALVVGATGMCGSLCMHQLLKDADYREVETWVRQPTGLQHPKLNERVIDFKSLDTMEGTDVEHVFCCLGTTIKKARSKAIFYTIDHDYVISIAEMAQRWGAERFAYISSIGASANSGNFYLHTKGKVEEDLQAAHLKRLLIFRPSFLIGERGEKRLGETVAKAMMRAFGYLLVGRLLKYRGVEASLVVKAMIAEAKKEATGVTIIESDKIQQYRDVDA